MSKINQEENAIDVQEAYWGKFYPTEHYFVGYPLTSRYSFINEGEVLQYTKYWVSVRPRFIKGVRSMVA